MYLLYDIPKQCYGTILGIPRVIFSGIGIRFHHSWYRLKYAAVIVDYIRIEVNRIDIIVVHLEYQLNAPQ